MQAGAFWGVGGWGGGNFEPGLEKREQKSNTM